MKQRMMVFLLSLTTVLGCREKLSEEYSFFGEYDLSGGQYKVLVFATERALMRDYRDFYIDDTETLVRMQEQWVFNYKIDPMSCGYTYSIKLVDQDEVLNQTSLNIECEYMSGWIFFPENYLTDHSQSFKKMTDSQKLDFIEKYN